MMKWIPFAAALILSAAPVYEPGIVSWDEAAKHEAILKSDPNNLRSRNLLLAWYTQHYLEPQAMSARLQHILWTIGNQPGMPLRDPRSLRVDERDREDFRQVREAWLEQVKKYPENPIVLTRAAVALMRSDRELAAQWLKSAIRIAETEAQKEDTWPPPVQPGSQWWTWSFAWAEATRTLAQLYTDAIAGITARTPWEGTGPVDPAISRSGFAQGARREVENSGDALLLIESAWWLHLTSESFQRDGRGEINYAPLAWEWFQKAEKLDGTKPGIDVYLDGFQRYWSSRIPGVVPPPTARVRLSGAEAPQPLETVPAVCPPEVQFPPSGTVVSVRLILATDGHVRFATLQGGAPGAIRPALNAARQWRFPPTYRGSQPVEVETSVAIPVCRCAEAQD